MLKFLSYVLSYNYELELEYHYLMVTKNLSMEKVEELFALYHWNNTWASYTFIFKIPAKRADNIEWRRYQAH